MSTTFCGCDPEAQLSDGSIGWVCKAHGVPEIAASPCEILGTDESIKELPSTIVADIGPASDHSWKHCPNCGKTGTNSGDHGGNSRCYHCGDCEYTNCWWRYPDDVGPQHAWAVGARERFRALLAQNPSERHEMFAVTRGDIEALLAEAE